MFGTLQPEHRALSSQASARYQTFYCGLCRSLGDHYNLVLRGTLSFDAVLLAIMADSLLRQGAQDGGRTRCPLVPVQTRAIVAPRSDALRFAAGMQMLLADQLLADRALDDHRLARLLRPALAGPVGTAHAMLDEIGIDLDALVGFEHRQHRLESQDPGPLDAAAPTAEALALVFGSIVELEGCVLHDNGPLRALGHALGRVIYLVDALDDLEDDWLGGRFNPCLHDGKPVVARITQTIEALAQARRELTASLAGLPLQRHRDLLDHILVERLGAQVDAASLRGRELLEERRRLEIEAWLASPPWHKALTALSAMMLALAALPLALWRAVRSWWDLARSGRPRRAEPISLHAPRIQLDTCRPHETAWRLAASATVVAAQTGEALAQKPKTPAPPKSVPDAGPDAGDIGTAPPTPSSAADMGTAPSDVGPAPSEAPDPSSATPPDASPPASGEGSQMQCDVCSGCNEGCGDMGEACSSCGSGCSGCGDGCSQMCGECTGGCGDCTKGCGDCSNGCNDICGDCGKGCGDCGGGCNDCCGSCGDCGRCCNDCGDCGNCCTNCNGIWPQLPSLRWRPRARG